MPAIERQSYALGGALCGVFSEGVAQPLLSLYAVDDHVNARKERIGAHGKAEGGVKFNGHELSRCGGESDVEREQRDERVRQIEISQRLGDGLVRAPRLHLIDDGERHLIEGVGGVGDGKDEACLGHLRIGDHKGDDTGERPFEHDECRAAEEVDGEPRPQKAARTVAVLFECLSRKQDDEQSYHHEREVIRHEDVVPRRGVIDGRHAIDDDIGEVDECRERRKEQRAEGVALGKRLGIFVGAVTV